MVKVNPLLERVSSAKAAAELHGSSDKGLVIDVKERDSQWKLEGKNKSGRPHKGRKAKFSSTVASKRAALPFEERMIRKKELHDMKAREKELIDDRIDKKRKHREALKQKE